MIALVAATLGACSSEDNELVPQQPATQQPSTQPEARPLTITVSETPFINPDDQSGSRGTRAAITTTSTLTAFKMDYVYTYGESRVTNGDKAPIIATKTVDNAWSISTGWPYTDNTVNWYAYTNFSNTYSFNVGSDASGDYIHFTVVDDPSSQKDLLVAKISDTWAHSGGNLSLTFDHACAALHFKMKKAKNLSDYTLTVSNVVLHNVVNAGDYYFGSQSWTLGATTSDYTLFSGSAELDKKDFTPMAESDPYLFLIPQTLTPWDPSGALSNAYLEITFSGYDDHGYIPFSATIAQGYQYDININIGKNVVFKNDGTYFFD